MVAAPFVCRRCARQVQRRLLESHGVARAAAVRSYSSHDTSPRPDGKAEDEPGPMARRLQEATEDALLTGGRSGRRAVEEAGFSDELRSRLLEKVAGAGFRADHAAAFREAGLTSKLPAAAGEGTRAIASAEAWTGDEAPADAVLRMLGDAHKPLPPGMRGKPAVPRPQGAPVDMRLRRAPAVSPGQKVATARDRAATYAGMNMKHDQGLTDAEREALRRELRERFAPAARALPSTVSGLAALANERIEDAIARGQFKNIPRGKGVERDARADNPFIDTTEYIMNKMIRRQDMVPPWIEKQQELVKAAGAFRARLRADWRRHAARMVASRGGTLQEQMARAEAYARAEAAHNPRRRDVDKIAVPSNATDDAVMAALRQEAPPEAPAPPAAATGASADPEAGSLVRPFRDPAWEAAERSYMELAIGNLNALTRSYNLMAPELAKKPYFSLERELGACFADVAPQLADVIRDRAVRPAAASSLPGGRAQKAGGLLGRLGGEGGPPTRVYDSKTPNYGLREMWRDLWRRSASS